MILEFLSYILYFINLTANREVLWIVLPLLIATIAMVVYFQRYKDEWPGWNTLVANSLVLLFVGMILLKYIYNLNDGGTINFTIFYGKFILSLVIILLGLIMVSLNFRHYLPKKLAVWISSPLTLNLIAYILLLIVYSDIKYNFPAILALLIWFLFLILVFSLIRHLFKQLFAHLKELKEKEKVEEILSSKKEFKQKKQKIAKEEKVVEKAKKEVNKQEKETKREQKKDVEKEMKKAIKLQKVMKK